jgi:hypothetical protein
MKAIIKGLRVPDFDAKPKVVERKDSHGRTVHDIVNPEVFAPWQVTIELESDGEVSRTEVAELLRQFKTGRPVKVAFSES